MKKLLVSLLILIMLVSGCGSNETTDTSSNTGSDQQTTDDSSVTSIDESIDTAYTAWEDEDPIYIYLSDDTSNTDASSGVTIDNQVITITAAGTYVLSGSLSDGQIIVEATSDENVRLVLNGVDIYCSDSAPIYIKQVKNATITLAEGSVNYLSDGSDYTLNSDEEPSATIFSKDDLKFNGTGTLYVEANYHNGIQSKDDLFILGGNITVTAVNNGLVGKDSVRIGAGNVTVTAVNDGIKATNDTDSTKGYVLINDGTITITSGGDGISAETAVLINGGTFAITAGEGSSVSLTSSSDSCKGIKATDLVQITNGTFTIDSTDDGIHSNDELLITDGTFTIASGDDGIHSDTTLTINGGSITISNSYEGIESATITINDGTYYIVSSDDGINVSGGNDQSSMNGRAGQNSFSSDTDQILTINGGYIVVVAAGDGIDANGSIVMTGGEVYVNGPTASDNGALDYNTTMTISGGTLLAIGSSNMAQAPSTSSSQYSMSITLSGFAEAGSVIQVLDGDDVLVEYTSLKEYSSIVVSSPEFTTGVTYTIMIDDTEIASTELSSTVTYVNSSSTDFNSGATQQQNSNTPSGGNNHPQK